MPRLLPASLSPAASVRRAAAEAALRRLCRRAASATLQARGKLAAVIDGLWWVFWLAAAAVSTNVLTMQGWSINQTRASCAFCWISWYARCAPLSRALAAAAAAAAAHGAGSAARPRRPALAPPHAAGLPVPAAGCCGLCPSSSRCVRSGGSSTRDPHVHSHASPGSVGHRRSSRLPPCCTLRFQTQRRARRHRSCHPRFSIPIASLRVCATGCRPFLLPWSVHMYYVMESEVGPHGGERSG